MEHHGFRREAGKGFVLRDNKGDLADITVDFVADAARINVSADDRFELVMIPESAIAESVAETVFAEPVAGGTIHVPAASEPEATQAGTDFSGGGDVPGDDESPFPSDGDEWAV